jgi:hypothetical protein
MGNPEKHERVRSTRARFLYQVFWFNQPQKRKQPVPRCFAPKIAPEKRLGSDEDEKTKRFCHTKLQRGRANPIW